MMLINFKCSALSLSLSGKAKDGCMQLFTPSSRLSGLHLEDTGLPKSSLN